MLNSMSIDIRLLQDPLLVLYKDLLSEYNKLIDTPHWYEGTQRAELADRMVILCNKMKSKYRISEEEFTDFIVDIQWETYSKRIGE
jgi:hypothetical protein